MKTCITCKHHFGTGRFVECHAPRNERPHATTTRFLVDPTAVWSSPRWRYTFASLHRQDGWLDTWLYSTCGRAGRWWEPMEGTNNDP